MHSPSVVKATACYWHSAAGTAYRYTTTRHEIFTCCLAAIFHTGGARRARGGAGLLHSQSVHHSRHISYMCCLACNPPSQVERDGREVELSCYTVNLLRDVKTPGKRLAECFPAIKVAKGPKGR